MLEFLFCRLVAGIEIRVQLLRKPPVGLLNVGLCLALGDLCLAGRAAMKHTAFGDEIGSSGAMNRAVDTAATEQR